MCKLTFYESENFLIPLSITIFNPKILGILFVRKIELIELIINRGTTTHEGKSDVRLTRVRCLILCFCFHAMKKSIQKVQDLGKERG